MEGNGKALILVVDDEPATLRLIQLRLKGFGYDVVTFTDSQKCLKMLSTSSPNLILLDYNMPVMNGLEVLRVIRERDRCVSVIMITAYGSEEVAVGALRAGANDYLTKPINFEELELVIRENLERNRLKLAEYTLRRQIADCAFELAGLILRAESIKEGLRQMRIQDCSAQLATLVLELESLRVRLEGTRGLR
jgi:DNA-binding response OmpR family regulator